MMRMGPSARSREFHVRQDATSSFSARASPSTDRIAVDAIEVLDLRRVRLVARATLVLRAALGRLCRRCASRCGGHGHNAGNRGAQQIAPADRGVELLLHGGLPGKYWT